MMSNILRAKRLTLEESVQALLGRISLGETRKAPRRERESMQNRGVPTPPAGWGSVSAFEGLSLVACHRPAFGVVVGSRGGAATPSSSIDVTIRLRGWRRFNDLGSTCSQLPPDSGSSAGAGKARASPRMASSCAAADALTARPWRVFPLRFHAMWIGTRLVAPRLPLLPFYFFSGCKGSIAFSRPPRQPREAPFCPCSP
jgi:hypothetical protein